MEVIRVMEVILLTNAREAEICLANKEGNVIYLHHLSPNRFHQILSLRTIVPTPESVKTSTSKAFGVPPLIMWTFSTPCSTA